ncbi:MAG: hypothetical protein ABR589_09645 [Chthoniobacterales bacterium]
MTFLKRILLVDYEPRVTATVRAALEKTGKYLIKVERDSRMALKAARWFQPDLILFDVMTGCSDAGLIARQLQADGSFKDTPVVFLSMNGSSDGGALSGGVLNGYSFLANPVRVEEVVRCVAELLSPATARRATARFATAR